MKVKQKIISIALMSIFILSSKCFAIDKLTKDICMNQTYDIVTQKIEEDTEFFKSNISYPILKIKKEYLDNTDYDKNIIENINEKISSDILDFANRIKEESKQYKKQYEDVYSKLDKDYVKYQYEAYSNYAVPYNRNNYLSIPIKTYEFTGGAHGMTYLKSYNYDLSSGKEILFKDLFKEGVDYKKIVDEFIISQISKNPNIYFEGTEGFKGISENQNFYIDDEGVVIYFQLYDIAPYYVGIPEFKMTWNEYRKYFK